MLLIDPTPGQVFRAMTQQTRWKFDICLLNNPEAYTAINERVKNRFPNRSPPGVIFADKIADIKPGYTVVLLRAGGRGHRLFAEKHNVVAMGFDPYEILQKDIPFQTLEEKVVSTETGEWRVYDFSLELREVTYHDQYGTPTIPCIGTQAFTRFLKEKGKYKQTILSGITCLYTTLDLNIPFYLYEDPYPLMCDAKTINKGSGEIVMGTVKRSRYMKDWKVTPCDDYISCEILYSRLQRLKQSHHVYATFLSGYIALPNSNYVVSYDPVGGTIHDCEIMQVGSKEMLVPKHNKLIYDRFSYNGQKFQYTPDGKDMREILGVNVYGTFKTVTIRDIYPELTVIGFKWVYSFEGGEIENRPYLSNKYTKQVISPEGIKGKQAHKCYLIRRKKGDKWFKYRDKKYGLVFGHTIESGIASYYKYRSWLGSTYCGSHLDNYQFEGVLLTPRTPLKVLN